MPLTVDTGPRIYLKVENQSDAVMRVHFTWSTMDMEQFLIKNESEDKNIDIQESEIFTFDHNCNHIMMTIFQEEQEVFKAKLENYTVSRTYTVVGEKNAYSCTSHEN